MTNAVEFFAGPKAPYDIVDYTFNYATWLGVDTITTSTWTVPSGITSHAESDTTTTATIWLSGGTAGETYTIVNQIVTASGRKKEQAFVVPMVC